MANTSFKDYLKEKIKQKPNLVQEIEKAKRALKIAHQIYQLRKQKGLTQKELAKMIGVSQSNIARIESADYNHYTMTTLYKVAVGLNVDLNIFITDHALTNKLITAFNNFPAFQNFKYEGSFGGSGIGTLNSEGLISMEDVISSNDVTIVTGSKRSEAEASKYIYQYL